MRQRLALLLIFAAAPAFAEDALQPAPAPAATQDAFTQALSSAYNTNPQLKAEREHLSGLDEGVAEAASGFRPNIGAEFDRGRQRQSVSGSSWIYSQTQTKELQVNQPLFKGGGTMAELKASRERVKAGRAQLLAAEQGVLYGAVSAYVDLAQAQAVLRLAEANVKVLSEQQSAVQSRHDAGTLTGTDVAQADSRLSSAQATLAQAQSDVEAARATFTRVVGYPPGEFELPEEHLPQLPATLEDASAQATGAFPDVVAAQFNEKAADADVDQRISTLLPSVALVGSMARSQGELFPGIRDYDDDSLTLNVKIPLYQSGSEYAKVRAAKDAREQAKFTALDARAAATENAAHAWHDYQASIAVIGSAEEAASSAETALKGIREEYDAGTRTTLDVLNTEQDLFSRQVDLVRARRARIIQAYRLLAATGQLTAAHLSLPVELYDPEAHYDHVKWLPLGF